MALEETSFRNSVFRAFFWLGTGTFIGQFISWLSTIVVIRLLSPSDYGLMAITAGVISLLTTISELGVGAAIVQAKELTEREIRQIFAWVLITGLIGLAACYASAPWVARFYNAPDLVAMIRVLAVTMFLVMAYIVPQALFIREMNFKVKAQVEISAQLATTLLTLILALRGMGVWSLVAGQMAMHLIKAIAFNASRPRWMAPLFDVRGSGRLLQYGLTVTGDRLLNFVFTESDKIIVGKVLGNAVLGVYAVALNLASIPMEKVLPIITQVSFTSYARIQDDMERIRRNLIRPTRAVAFAGFPIFFGMSAVAPVGIPLILGSKWEPIVVPFQLLCLILPLKALYPILPPAVFAIGRPAVNLVNMMLLSTVMASAFLVGVQAGVIGVCVAWLVAYPVVFGIATIRSLRVLGLPAGRYLAEIRFPFFASVLMLVSVGLLGRIIVTPQPLYSLILLIAFGLVLYLSLVLIFKKEQYAEIQGLLQRR
jgi:O-antigen/teichoic acid export membrane protein